MRLYAPSGGIIGPWFISAIGSGGRIGGDTGSGGITGTTGCDVWICITGSTLSTVTQSYMNEYCYV